VPGPGGPPGCGPLPRGPRCGRVRGRARPWRRRAGRPGGRSRSCTPRWLRRGATALRLYLMRYAAWVNPAFRRRPASRRASASLTSATGAGVLTSGPQPACVGIRTILSNRTPLTCGVLADEQYGLAGVPDDHEQSDTVVIGAGPVIQERCCLGCADSHRELSAGYQPHKVGDDGNRHGM
jgi:hypothetical protein